MPAHHLVAVSAKVPSRTRAQLGYLAEAQGLTVSGLLRAWLAAMCERADAGLLAVSLADVSQDRYNADQPRGGR